MGATVKNMSGIWAEPAVGGPVAIKGLSVSQAPPGGTASHAFEAIGAADHDDLVGYAYDGKVVEFETLIATTPAASLYSGLSTAEKAAARLAFKILK